MEHSLLTSSTSLDMMKKDWDRYFKKTNIETNHTVKLVIDRSSLELTQSSVDLNPAEPGFMKYDKYVIPESSSSHGEARYSGSRTIGTSSSRWASLIALRQFSTASCRSKKKINSIIGSYINKIESYFCLQ